MHKTGILLCRDLTEWPHVLQQTGITFSHRQKSLRCERAQREKRIHRLGSLPSFSAHLINDR